MKECAMTACKRIAVGNSGYCERHSAICLIPGCEFHVRTLGMCNTHYNNYLRKRNRIENDHLCFYPDCQELQEAEGFCLFHLKMKRGFRKPKKCVVPWCDQRSVNGLFCEEHDHNFAQTGGPERMIKLCGVPGCSEPHDLKGLCQKHYAQFKRSLDRRIRSSFE